MTADLPDLERRLRALSAEEFSSLVYRMTMRAGGEEVAGAVLVVHWGHRQDVHVLFPTASDPAESAEIMNEMREAAAEAVDDVMEPKLVA
jgi:hypothetical protein